jgi:hypothetical protein
MQLYLIYPENEAYLRGKVDRPVKIYLTDAGLASSFRRFMMYSLSFMLAGTLIQGLRPVSFLFFLPAGMCELLLLVFFVMVFFAIGRNLELRLFCKGARKLKGKLLGLEVEEYEDGNDRMRVFTIVDVEFRAPDGSVMRGKRRYETGRGKSQPPPEQAVVAVLYKDNKRWEVL